MKQIPAIAALSYLGGHQPEPPWRPSPLLAPMERRLLDHYGLSLAWEAVIEPASDDTDRIAALADFLAELNRRVAACLRRSQRFLVLGGDHANAVGIWGAALQHFAADTRLGLLWIDAHMDCHTFTTTPSGNIHGMPLASLMGIEDPSLQRFYGGPHFLPPQRLQLYGARSYEIEEEQRVAELDIPVVYMDRIQREGVEKSLTAAFSRLLEHCDVYGISIDIDAIDPLQAPAVSTPVADGIAVDELCTALHRHRDDDRLIGVEIAEYYPSLDQDGATQKVIADLIGALFG